MRPTPHRRLRVAIVVASLRIVGGHSVQARRLLNGWANDSDVDAWIVPINPVPPKPFLGSISAHTRPAFTGEAGSYSSADDALR